MGTTRQKSSCRNRLQNGPRSLSRVKVGTHSAFGERSHTRAHTAKHGAFRMGALSLPSDRSTRSPTSPGRVSERRTLPLLGLGRGCAPEERREPAEQRCAYARRCSEASRPRWAAQHSFRSAYVVFLTLGTRGFLRVRGKGGITTLGVLYMSSKRPMPACQSG